MSRAVMQQALEALVTCCAEEWRTLNNFGMKQVYDEKKVNAAIAALHAALAEPEQEPVAWSEYNLDAMVEAFGRVIEAHHANNHPFHNPIDSDARMALRILCGFIPAMKAYTAPTPRKPLTDEEIADLWDGQLFHITDLKLATDFVRDIERAHGIGESNGS